MKWHLAIPAMAVALVTATSAPESASSTMIRYPKVGAGGGRGSDPGTLLVEAAPGGTIAAKEQLCALCHGRSGLPSDQTVPIIWGQRAAYIRKQLNDYRNGDRDSQIMSSIAESLNDREITQIADHFGAAEWPRRATATPPSNASAITACEACHRTNFTGGTSVAGTAPRLAGQFSLYLIDTMTAYASGERANSTQMSALMQSLSPADRKSIAEYLAAMR